MSDIPTPVSLRPRTAAEPRNGGRPPGRTAPDGRPRDDLCQAARAFEAAFLAEMLRHSGLGRMPDRFNGGAGEAAFSGTLVREYANRIAAGGGIGLAEQIYRSLAARAGE